MICMSSRPPRPAIPTFFEFSDRARFIDLDVGYKELAGKPFVKKTYLD